MGCQKIIIIIFHLSSHPHQGNDIWITSWEILITSCDIWITSCGVQFTGLVTVHTIFDTHTHTHTHKHTHTHTHTHTHIPTLPHCLFIHPLPSIIWSTTLFRCLFFFLSSYSSPRVFVLHWSLTPLLLLSFHLSQPFSSLALSLSLSLSF